MVRRVDDLHRGVRGGILTFVYGLDLAQSLNYTGIVVTNVADAKIRIIKVRKYNKLTYPELEKILFDLFNKFTPKCVVVDYTNERSFAETIESKLHPSFMDQHSAKYKKWETVQPVIFSQEIKLELKQTAREIFEKKQFAWPRFPTDPRVRSLITELKDQMLREAGSPGANGLLRFPKPEGHDNDLIIALELNLYGAKKFLYYDSSRWFVPGLGKYNPMEKFTCNSCKENIHPGTIHQTYWEATDIIDCPCKPCNGLV